MLPLSTMNVLGFSGMWFLRIIAAQAYYFMLAWHFIPEWQDRSSSRLWLTYKVTRAAVATSAVIALMTGTGSDDDYGEYYRTVSWAERGATFLELLLVTAWLSTHALWRRRTAEGIGLWLLAAVPIGLFATLSLYRVFQSWHWYI